MDETPIAKSTPVDAKKQSGKRKSSSSESSSSSSTMDLEIQGTTEGTPSVPKKVSRTEEILPGTGTLDFAAAAKRLATEARSTRTSWYEATEAERLELLSVLRRLTIGDDIEVPEAEATIPSDYETKLPALFQILTAGARAAAIELTFDENPSNAETMPYRDFFGKADVAFAAFKKDSKGKPTVESGAASIVLRFLQALAVRFEEIDIKAIGRDGAIYAAELVYKTICANRGVSGSKVAKSFFVREPRKDKVMESFQTVFQGLSGVGEHIFGLASQMLVALGRRLAGDNKTLHSLEGFFNSITATSTQCASRSYRFNVEKTEVAILNPKTGKPTGKTEEDKKVKLHPPQINLNGAPLTDVEKTVVKKLADDVLTFYEIVKKDDFVFNHFIGTDRYDGINETVQRLYGITTPINKLIDGRRGGVAAIAKQARIDQYSVEQQNTPAVKLALAKKFNQDEWKRAEANYLNKHSGFGQDLIKILKETPGVVVKETKDAQVVEQDKTVLTVIENVANNLLAAFHFPVPSDKEEKVNQ